MYKTVKDKKIPLWEDDRVWSKLRCGLWILIGLIVVGVIVSQLHIHHRDECPDATLKEIVCKSRHEDVCYYVIDADYGQTSKLRRLQIEGHTHTVPLRGPHGLRLGSPCPTSCGLPTTFTEGHSSNVLQIGLGGGVSGAFLDTKSRAWRSTPQSRTLLVGWYNTPSTNRHQVVVADGFAFVKERSPMAPKYDFAVVDTSYDDDFHLMISPVAIFSREEFAENLRRLMNDTNCSIVLNTYTHHKELEKLLDAEKFRHDTLITYRKYFPTCFFVETSGNNILFCSCQNLGEMTQERYERLFREMPAILQPRLRVKYLVRSDW
ncbi:hypothetical protein M3Y99_00758800 [Aphelenchoides fujianensis]|nr:hypothetical protein M3Y99_00758800 [Aphelenchoides fujianensis]